MGKYINEQGNRYNRLYVMCEAGRDKYGSVLYLCKCDCGNFVVVRASRLRGGYTKSCGCLQRESAAILCRTLGKKNKNKKFSEEHKKKLQGKNSLYYKHGFSKERIFRIWNGMKNRCNNPNATGYKYWGGKGVQVCDDWLNNFITFKDWALSSGYKKNLTIDRIDSDGNYEPNNCRWITRSENTRKATTKLFVEKVKGKARICINQDRN